MVYLVYSGQLWWEKKMVEFRAFWPDRLETVTGNLALNDVGWSFLAALTKARPDNPRLQSDRFDFYCCLGSVQRAVRELAEIQSRETWLVPDYDYTELYHPTPEELQVFEEQEQLNANAQ